MYPANSIVGRMHIMSRHSVSHFSSNLSRRVGFCLGARAKKLNINKLQLIPPSRDRTHSRRVIVTPMCQCAKTASKKIRYIFKLINTKLFYLDNFNRVVNNIQSMLILLRMSKIKSNEIYLNANKSLTPSVLNQMCRSK